MNTSLIFHRQSTVGIEKKRMASSGCGWRQMRANLPTNADNLVGICQQPLGFHKNTLHHRSERRDAGCWRKLGLGGWRAAGVLSLPRPELRGEDDEDGEYFQTADEHHEGAHPLGECGQVVPRHGGADLRSQGGSHVADAAQGDGDGVGVVDAGSYHHEGTDEAQHEIGCEEGQERDPLAGRDVVAVDTERQRGVGVEHLSELVLHHLEQHDAAHALQAAACGARAGSDEHAQRQRHPRDVGPFAGVVVEEACGGDERHHLEDARAEGVLYAVAVARHQLNHDEQREAQHKEEVEPELAALEEVEGAELGQAEIEQREVDAREEAEECGDIVHGG